MKYNDHSLEGPKMRILLPAAALFLAAAASIYLLVFPTGEGYWGGRLHRTTLLESQGPSASILVSIPVAIALLPLVFRRQGVRIGAVIVLWGFAIIGGFSIGLFYVPSAAVAQLAGCVDS